MCGLSSPESWQGPVAGPSERGNEHRGSTKGRKFLDKFGDCQTLPAKSTLKIRTCQQILVKPVTTQNFTLSPAGGSRVAPYEQDGRLEWRN